MKREIKYTPQGYSYVDVSLEECLNWGGAGICAMCDKIHEELKLIYVLGDVYCNNCFNEWLERQKKYIKSDIEYDMKAQERNDKKFYECYSKYFVGGSNEL